MPPMPSGYALRPATTTDLEGVAAVLTADDLADTGQVFDDADFVRYQWSKPGVDLSADAWTAESPAGLVVAHALVMPEGEGLVSSWGIVHPEHRGLGIGSRLLDLIEGRAAERLRGVRGARLHHAVTDVDRAAARMVRNRGFAPVRSYRHMQIDLDGPRDPGEPPPGIRIGGIDPARDLRRVHAIFVEAFRDEWGYRVIPFEEWSALEVEGDDFDPSLWLLATESREAVGALTAVTWGDRGWVGELGVRGPWRGRGVGSALLRRSFATFAERGLSRVMLNVDSENPTGAVRLYERVGMRPVRGWDLYERSLAPQPSR